jgi:hypothetical protein
MVDVLLSTDSIKEGARSRAVTLLLTTELSDSADRAANTSNNVNGSQSMRQSLETLMLRERRRGHNVLRVGAVAYCSCLVVPLITFFWPVAFYGGGPYAMRFYDILGSAIFVSATFHSTMLIHLTNPPSSPSIRPISYSRTHTFRPCTSGTAGSIFDLQGATAELLWRRAGLTSRPSSRQTVEWATCGYLDSHH